MIKRATDGFIMRLLNITSVITCYQSHHMYCMNLCRQGNKSDIDHTKDQKMSHLMIPTIGMAWEIPNHIKI